MEIEIATQVLLIKHWTPISIIFLTVKMSQESNLLIMSYVTILYELAISLVRKVGPLCVL